MISGRRKFLSGVGAMAAPGVLGPLAGGSALGQHSQVPKIKSPFRVAVIDDEISQDFGRACEVASREFGMEWIELRGLWNKNIVNLDAKEIAEAQRILKKYQLRAADIASPLFKVDWPGAPKSRLREDAGSAASFTFAQQDEVLYRALELAKAFQIDRVRCFDFWRLDDPAPFRAAMNDKLRDAATKAGEKGITLLLENESACNTATGAEAAVTLRAVKSPHLMLNWDPGNAAASGETPYPDGYNLLPKQQIGHCHCKDAVKSGKGYDWAPMGAGIIDWAGQFRALKRDRYHHVVSLETHWGGGGSPEESSRQSWAGMKQLLSKAEAL
ncbi:MAG TPA: sugar phosphate isomerase/epimerase family protein [Terriglobales bacterium]|nr:sugar phosphate isomerase/epimerase family protein [Terriglobales bacterium]